MPSGISTTVTINAKIVNISHGPLLKNAVPTSAHMPINVTTSRYRAASIKHADHCWRLTAQMRRVAKLIDVVLLGIHIFIKYLNESFFMLRVEFIIGSIFINAFDDGYWLLPHPVTGLAD